MIIPFFIPHAGCRHQCVFCNQRNISGQVQPVHPSALHHTINEYLRTNHERQTARVAFYGGSFTALPPQTQKEYLASVLPFIESGLIGSIRLSTRPDAINREILGLLKTYHVDTVELGAQSMDDHVLACSGRGHTAHDTITSVALLREYGFSVGLQLMAGLPGDSAQRFRETVGKIIDLKSDFVRIYPTLVIQGTPLQELYQSGRYRALSLVDAVALCKEALIRFKQAGVAVIRIGLQATEELEQQGTILAGPYHPAFRQLVESAIWLDRMRQELKNRKSATDTAVFVIDPRNLSYAVGQQQSNKRALKREFGLKDVRILPGKPDLIKEEVILLTNTES